MRAISQYRGYEGITAQPEKKMVLADGQEQILQKGLRAVPFTAGGLTEWEIVEAHRQWPSMRGLSDGEIVVARFSVFDSFRAQAEHGWTDAEREIVEEALRTGPGAGSDYIIVESPKVPVPYAKYDQHRKVQGKRTLEHVLADIQGAFEATGFDVGQAVAYERENGNNPDIIAALEALAGPAVAEEELVEA